MLDQIGKELSAGVLHQVVKPDTGPNEHLFHLGNVPQFPQEYHIIGVVGIQIGTGLWGKTGTVFAQTVFELLLAGGAAEGG